MIRYVQNKTTNFRRIEELLSLSAKAGAFTNNGPVKQLLEHYLEQLLGLNRETHRLVCTSSGTSALYVLVSMYEAGTELKLNWATPAFNFPAACVNKLATKIIDIDPETFTLDLRQIDDSIDGLIITSLFGTVPKNLEEIEKYCDQTDSFLILDNASSPLSSFHEKNISLWGNSSFGSLHHTKFLGYSEGGFAVIPATYYDSFLKLTNFGFKDDRKHDFRATNAKMSDVSAAFILAHLESYNLEKHLQVQRKYLEVVNNIPGVKAFNSFCETKLVRGNMAVVFDKPTSHLSFRDVGIEANKYYKPLAALPNSQYLFDRIVNLPLHSDLTDYELSLIFKKIEAEAKK